MWSWLFLIFPIWIFYRLVVEGEPGKPALMEMAQEKHEAAMLLHRIEEQKRARASFENLANRYRNGEIEWETVMETMWMAHPHEMQTWQTEWEGRMNGTMH